MAITGHTGTNHVLPGVLSAAVPGNDMIQGELPGLLTAVLACVPVTVKNLKTSQLSFPAGAPNQATKPPFSSISALP